MVFSADHSFLKMMKDGQIIGMKKLGGNRCREDTFRVFYEAILVGELMHADKLSFKSACEVAAHLSGDEIMDL